MIVLYCTYLVIPAYHAASQKLSCPLINVNRFGKQSDDCKTVTLTHKAIHNYCMHCTIQYSIPREMALAYTKQHERANAKNS